MAITESLRLILTADTAGAVKGINDVGRAAERSLSRSEKSLDRWGNRLTTVGAGFVAFGAVAAAGLHSAAQSAGELEQAVGGTEAVFKDASGIIDEYASGAAKAAGLSENEFRLATTAIGGNLKRMGFDVDEAASKSVELTQTAADLAATYGGTTAEAVQALGAAFRGEADPAERFNLDLKVSKVNAEAVALGLASSTAAVDDNARAQALLSLITKQSADAQGQFGRESDTLAGRQQILAAEFENLKAEIGEGVVPAMETLFGVARGGIGAFSGLNDATGGALGQVATIGTVASLGVGGLSLLAGQAIKTRDNLRAAAEAVSGFSGRLGGLSGLVSGLTIIAPLAVGAGIALKAYSDTKAEAKRITDRYVDALKEEAGATREATDAVSAAELTAGDLGSKLRDAGADLDVFNEAIRNSGDALEHLDNEAGLIGTVGLAEVLERAGLAGSEFADEILRVTENMSTGETVELIDRLDGLSDRYDDATVAAANTEFAERELADQHGETAGATGDLADETGNATSALQEYSDQLAAMTDPVFGMVTALQDQQAAAARVAEAQTALNEALAGGDPTVIAEAERDYQDALTGASEALVGTQSAELALNDAIAANPGLVDTAKRAIYDMAIAQGYTAAQAAEMAGQFDTATYAAVVLGQQRPSIPVSAPGLSTVIGQFDDLARAVNAASGGKFRVSVGGGGGLTMHEGGYVPGPRGQEVAAILQAGERVLSLDEVDKMSRGIPAGPVAAGGMSSVMTVNIGRVVSNDPVKFVEGLQSYQRTHGAIPIKVKGTGW